MSASPHDVPTSAPVSRSSSGSDPLGYVADVCSHDQNYNNTISNRVAKFSDSDLHRGIIDAVIDAHDENILDPKYCKTAEWFNLKQLAPNIEGVLQAAHEAKDFRDICRLNILQSQPRRLKLKLDGGASGVAQSPDHVLYQIKATELAWRAKYVGKNHKLLQDTIIAIVRENQHADWVPYSNLLPLVQSSGTGKSRAVRELASLIFTIPLNLRSDNRNGGYSYPPPDSRVRNRLVDLGESASMEERSTLYRGFLNHAFGVFKSRITEWAQQQGLGRETSDLPLRWREYLESPVNEDVLRRNEIWNEVVFPPQEIHADPNIKQAACELGDVISSYGTASEDLGPIRLLIYVDEVHTLVEKKCYDTFCSAITDARPHVFVILLSTNSKISAMARPEANHPSERVAQGGSLLQPPFCETAFDLPWEDPETRQRISLRPGDFKLSLLQSVKYLALFGRPLWHTRYVSGNETVQRDIVIFARKKLTGQERGHAPSASGALAVITTRVELEFEPRMVHSHVEAESMVESHMRIVYSVPAHRTFMWSGTPSEPILAEAAAQEMASWKRGMILKYLADFTANGLIEKGNRGELVARVLLTLAYDAAVKKSHTVYADNILYSNGCLLTAFLSQLLTGFEKVLKLKPRGEAQGTELKDAFKNSWVRFTHFGRLSDDSKLGLANVFRAFVRGMAIQCAFCQEGIDIVIPVLLDKEAPVGKLNMSFILISVKNRNFPVSQDISATNLGLLDEHSKSRPYIAFMMQVGTLESRLRQKHNTSGPPDPPHSQYWIDAIGCKVYRVINPEDLDHYAMILKARTFIDDHPRGDPDWVNAVRNLKPFWSDDGICNDWIDDLHRLEGDEMQVD